MIDLASPPGANALAYRSQGPVTAVRWSAGSDTLEVALFRRSVWRLTPGTSKTPVFMSQLPSAWAKVDFKFQSHGPLVGALIRQDWVTQVTRVARDRRYRYLNAFIDQDLTMFGADTERDYAAVRLDSPSTGPSAFGLGDVSAIDGDLHYSGADQLPSDDESVPYARPFVDLATGRQAGTYTPWEISTSLGIQVSDPSGVFKSVSKSGENTVALIGDATGAHRLVAIAPDGERRAIPICTNSSIPDGETAPERRFQPIPFRNADGAILFHGLLATTDASSDLGRSLVIRFHGGPLTSVFETFPDASAQRLSRMQIDTIDIDYPGSSGLGSLAATALARMGGDAIEDAAFRVMSWADTRSYERVYVIGESFGAPFAMQVAKAFPDRVNRLILLAPFTRLSMELGLGGRPLPGDPRLPQAAFELRAFGPVAQRQALATWMRQTFDSSCPSVPTTIYLGGADKIPDREHLAVSCLKTAEIIEVPELTHSTLFTDEEMWDRLETYMRPVPGAGRGNQVGAGEGPHP